MPPGCISLQSSLHLIHLTSLRRRYHPQPRQLELSLVVPLKILHQILYFIEPSSESFSLKNASTFVHTDLCSWQGRFFTFRLPPVTSPPNFPTPTIPSFSVDLPTSSTAPSQLAGRHGAADSSSNSVYFPLQMLLLNISAKMCS